MTAQDLFGLQREERIKSSKVRNVFTPHSPIQSVALFFGRQKEVQKIIEQINTPGQHSLLYGDRGVGKSSLANIATDLLISKLIKGKLFSKRCDSQDTFLSILEEPLKECGVEIFLESTTKSHKQSGSAGVKIPVASAGINSEKNTSQVFSAKEITPSRAAKIFTSPEGLLYIDEADRIQEKKDKSLIAELIKLLSDNNSKFKILIVGIADTADELTGAHPSVQRCLKETKLNRMNDNELKQIITEGAKKIKLNFEENVVSAIVRLSSGYPHFAHLLALKCAEEAIAGGKKNIDSKDLAKAIRIATEDAEGTLKRKYDETVRSYTTDMYKTILFAAAKLGRDEFSAEQLRSKISTITGKLITQGSLNNYLKRLVAADRSAIITRLSKGVYRFCDPRMPSYVRIANNDWQDAQPSA